MEVHTHSHTARKKWTHYFWEFFMLFLAVTLGFFVENWREHYIERKKEKEYIHSMLSDLSADTANFHRKISKVNEAVRQLDTLIRLLNKSSRDSTQQQRLYYLARISSRILEFFYINNTTYEQMKSSGNLRILKNYEIARAIANYYNNVYDMNTQNDILVNRQTVLIEAIKKVFNQAVFQEMLDIHSTATSYPKGNPLLITEDKYLKNELVGSIHYFSTVGSVNANNALAVGEEADRLIFFLKKEYHLK
jgi:hypothetical protein